MGRGGGCTIDGDLMGKGAPVHHGRITGALIYIYVFIYIDIYICIYIYMYMYIYRYSDLVGRGWRG